MRSSNQSAGGVSLDASAALIHLPLPSGWERRALQCEGREVCILSANHPADALAVPLRATGRVEVHLGLFRPRGKVCSMQVRLSSERLWRRVEPMLFTDDPGGGLQDGLLGVFDVRPEDALIIRTEPASCASLAYVRTAAAPASGGMRCRKNVGAVIDVNSSWGKYRIEEPDDMLAMIAPYADSDFDRICWNTAAGSFRATYFSNVMPLFGEGSTVFPMQSAKRAADVMAMFQRRGVDPLELVTDFAHKIGLQLWADDRICHAFDPDESAYAFLCSDFYAKNQHMRVMTMEGQKHWQAMLSLAYPEFRELKVRFLVEQARYNVDGIYIDFTRKSPMVGWEPPVLDSFKAIYGKDPHDLPEIEWNADWMAHQAGFVTQFMRELRAALNEVESQTGRHLPVAAQVPAGWRFHRNMPECYANGLDVAAWAREGLVDIIAPSDDLWYRPIHLDHLPALLEGTHCELWGCLHQRAPECFPSRHAADDANVYLEAHVDPMIILRSAADLYNQGAAGIFLWESGELPSVLPRWEVLKHLGDRERLKGMFGPSVGFMDGRGRMGQIHLP